MKTNLIIAGSVAVFLLLKTNSLGQQMKGETYDTVRYFRNGAYYVHDKLKNIRTFYFDGRIYKIEFYSRESDKIEKVVYYDFIDDTYGLTIFFSASSIDSVEYIKDRKIKKINDEQEVIKINAVKYKCR